MPACGRAPTPPHCLRPSSVRIAQVAPLIYTTPPAASGGTERVVHDLTTALVALGCEVTLFAAEGSTSAGRLIPCGRPIASTENAPPGLPAAREAVMLDRLATMADAFDCVHCHTEFFHAAVLRRHRAKTLTTIHWRVDEADRQAFLSGFPDLPVAAISQSQLRRMPMAANAQGVVHHGIALDRFRFAAGGPTVAFIGRMTDQKGPDRAILAARAAGRPIALAGDIDVGNPNYYRERVAPLLADDARYVGPINDDEKQELLGRAAVLAFPIDWPEPFGLVLIEAMACGTPVAAVRRGAVEEVVEDGVTGIIVDTVEGMADAIERAAQLDRRTVRARFEARFSAERMAREYLAIYTELARSAFETTQKGIGLSAPVR